MVESKSKSKSESKLRNSGGQGCIFDPAIPCKGDKTASKKKASKKKKDNQNNKHA